MAIEVYRAAKRGQSFVRVDGSGLVYVSEAVVAAMGERRSHVVIGIDRQAKTLSFWYVAAGEKGAYTAIPRGKWTEFQAVGALNDWGLLDDLVGRRIPATVANGVATFSYVEERRGTK